MEEEKIEKTEEAGVEEVSEASEPSEVTEKEEAVEEQGSSEEKKVENNTEEKKRRGLAFKFGLFFCIFGLITIVVSAFIAFLNQTEAYHKECENSLQVITAHTASLIRQDGPNFYDMVKFFNERRNELKIPKDFRADSAVKRREFNEYVTANHPMKTYGINLSYGDLSAEGQRLICTATFEDWLDKFLSLTDNFGLSYLYFVIPSDDGSDDIIYVLDPSLDTTVTEEGDEILALAYKSHKDSLKYKNLWETWRSGQPAVGFDSEDNEYGYVYTYYYPLTINGKKLGLICADISVAYVNSAILSAVLRQSAVLVLIVLCSVIGLYMIIRKHLIVRLSQLEHNVASYSDDKDQKVAEKIREQIRSTDEIDSLSTEFADMIDELEDYMTNLQTVTAEKERIGAELDVAKNIQASMLPRIFPPFPERDDIELYATMDPAKEVGGDFYDFFLLDDTHLALVMADVSGKGVPAALIMVIAKTLIKNHLLAGESVEEALAAASMQLLENNDEMLFVTTWVGIVDLKSGHVDFCDAGHEPAFLMHEDGTVTTIKPKKKKPPLSTVEGIKYLKYDFEMQKNDILYLYTDGVPEATSADVELYSKERLEEFLTKHTKDAPRKLLAEVKKNVDAFVGKAPQFDDMTMLAFRFQGEE
ncbi:MAG: PP2C family protein-serine/threonine phosphatase [Lachnospiraceae bacterium]|nr:PP2C family protein-serine/threonine phosphatase [Lachnospiraceae bacterium]